MPHTVSTKYTDSAAHTVQARGISRSFGRQVMLDQVDLDVAAGSVTALLGPNGAGKTTLVRILATLDRPDSGTALVAGHDLLTDPAGVRAGISLTGQFAAIDGVLSGQENLEMMGRLWRLSPAAARRRATALLADFGLADAGRRRAGTYSGGMRRRLDLAISMIATPRLVFLDEPTTGLDPRSREQLWGTVRGLADQGVTILLTTQYLDEADALASQVVLLDHGRVAAAGPPEELKASIGGEMVRLQFAGPSPFRQALGVLEVARADERLFVIEVATDGSAARIGELLGQLARAGAAAERLTVHRPRLDDVFFQLTNAGPGPAGAAGLTQPAEPAEPATEVAR